MSHPLFTTLRGNNRGFAKCHECCAIVLHSMQDMDAHDEWHQKLFDRALPDSVRTAIGLPPLNKGAT